MEGEPVVEPAAHKMLDARNMHGRQVRTHADDDPAIAEIEIKRVLRVGRGLGFRRTGKLHTQDDEQYSEKDNHDRPPLIFFRPKIP